MSVLQKVAEAVNKRMNERAEQIVDELHSAGYKYYPGSTNVVPSFRIMDKEEDSWAGGSFRAGFLRRVRIGSTLKEAYWAVHGNGGRGAVIRSKRKYDRNGRKPGKLGTPPGGIPGIGYRTSVHGYEGHDFVKEVARRHR